MLFIENYSKTKIIRKNILSFLLFAFIFAGCSDKDPINPDPEFNFLVSYEESLTRSKEEITAIIDFVGLDDIDAFMKYNISVYIITYKTVFLNQEIIASGLVAFPETDEAIPLLSFQHGTITLHSDAPTEDSYTYGLLSSVASAGYIFCIPDLIGFGASKDKNHPYYHAESTAVPVIDMMHGAEELATYLGYNFDGNIFLGGYSEGGYATLATQKMLEENPQPGWSLVVSAPSSGGYDIKGMQKYFFSLETYHQPSFLAYVALSYQTVYNWNTILSDIFQEPYASDIPNLFDGTLSASQINDKLTEQISDLLQPEYLANADTDNKYKYLNDAFMENSLDNWVPEIRTIFYHGTEDITVPYQNSVDTYQKMLSLGASEEVVSLIPLDGMNHNTGIYAYLEKAILTFDQLR